MDTISPAPNARPKQKSGGLGEDRYGDPHRDLCVQASKSFEFGMSALRYAGIEADVKRLETAVRHRAEEMKNKYAPFIVIGGHLL